MLATRDRSADTRFWTAMLLASIVGTTFGDFLAVDLRFGYLRSLPALGIGLVLFVVVQSLIPTVETACYWTAIVLTRTAATNLADLATHQLKLSNLWLEVLLFLGLFALALPRLQSKELRRAELWSPRTSPWYWAMVLTASVFGTVAGDWLADAPSVGLTRAVWITLTLFVSTLVVVRAAHRSDAIAYWGLLLSVRTAGTNAGDFLAAEDGLGLGHLRMALAAVTVLTILLLVWKSQKQRVARSAVEGQESL